MGGSLDISDDLINFWEEPIKNKMADGGHFEKKATRRACGRDIFCSGSLTLPYQVRPSDYQSDLDNRCALQLYEREGVRAT